MQLVKQQASKKTQNYAYSEHIFSTSSYQESQSQ
jgi:hypothetical protein